MVSGRRLERDWDAAFNSRGGDTEPGNSISFLAKDSSVRK